MYLSAPPRRRRLGRLGSQAMPLSLATAVPSTPGQLISSSVAAGQGVPSASDVCSVWDFYFNPTAWNVCSQQFIAAAPQSVVANATAAGYSPDVIAAAQAAADEQSSHAAADAANIANFYGAGNLNPFFTPGSPPGSPTNWPLWVWIAILGGGGLLAWSMVK
jgi:hypothetical protein